MASTSTTQDEDEVISGINVTPLVDVVLVLLIIFMITAPALYQSAIKVQLPKAKSGEELAQKKAPYQFTITQSGDLMWDKEKVDWNGLNQRLTALGAQAGDQTAVISADEQVPHGTVIKLMDSLRSAGLTKFALNVEAKK